MTDERVSAVDRFLRGQSTLEDLQRDLQKAVAADVSVAPAVSRYLDLLFQQGRLPFQVHAALKPIVSEGERTAARPRAQPQHADVDVVERTRTRPVPTNLESADSTRLKPSNGPRSMEYAAPDQSVARVATSPTMGTGSNWAHPEQWTPRQEGPLGPGSVVKNRFVLETLVGQGGMGVVYKALDRNKEEARDRSPYVAIKILSEEFRQHPNSLVALQREAVKAQTLAHPNIITVHDFDRDGTTVFMTMELLEGQTLNRLISSNKLRGLPKEKAVPLIRGMAEALSYAHKKGIVHSDLKPGNVFLTRNEELKVLDFGIARAVPTALKPDADNTVFDAAELGALTPPYASAEMLRGETPAPADDVFALGIIAYELLTGRHPFDRQPADTARLRGVVAAPIPGISRRQRRALSKALAFERSSRQADARSFLREFDGPTPVRKSIYAAMIVLAIGLTYAVYLNTLIRPDIAFEDLPQEEQARFFEAISNAKRALQLGDVALEDALTAYSTAYEIHRNNPEAIEGLELVADRGLSAMRANEPGTRERAVRRLFCQEYLSTYRPVVEACEETSRAVCTWASMSCPEREGQ